MKYELQRYVLRLEKSTNMAFLEHYDPNETFQVLAHIIDVGYSLLVKQEDTFRLNKPAVSHTWRIILVFDYLKCSILVQKLLKK